MQESEFDIAILHLPPINLNNYRVWFPYSPHGADPELRQKEYNEEMSEMWNVEGHL